MLMHNAVRAAECGPDGWIYGGAVGEVSGGLCASVLACLWDDMPVRLTSHLRDQGSSG